MKKTIIATMVVSAFMLSGCTVSESTARGAIEAQGMTSVKLGGFAMFGCGENDNFTRKFTATGANNSEVKGVVCAGLIKGATVRVQSVKPKAITK